MKPTINESREDQAERLAWEFDLSARNAFNWVMSGNSLLRAADLVFGRYLEAVKLKSTLRVGQPLSPTEVALLPDECLGPVALMFVVRARASHHG